jgi:signal transduction histidine kinase
MVQPLLLSRTWLDTAWAVTSLPVALVVFTTTVTMLSLSLGLLVLVVGAPLLVVTLVLVRGFAWFERERAQALLGVTIGAYHEPRASGLWPSVRWLMVSLSTWKSLAYAVLLLPVGVVTFVAAVFLWPAALALVLMPVYASALRGGSAHLGIRDFNGPWGVAGATVLGIALLLVAPWVMLLLGELSRLLTANLLGPGGRAQLAARVDELQTTRARGVDAAEDERRRIERDLHDGAQQRLVALAMDLGMAKEAWEADPDKARGLLDEAHAEAKRALVELRDLARGLHPAILSDRGLEAALSALVARVPVPVHLHVDLPARPARNVEAIAYFIAAESLTNIAKHAQAHAAWLTLVRSGDLLRLEVTDDGVGGAVAVAAGGLRGLMDRAASIDGRVTLTSPPGGPTRLLAELPCAS